MISTGKGKNKFCFLLSSTIKPNITVYSKRNNPKIREKDYCSVVEALVKTNLPIVYCDSSDYPLDNIEKILSEFLPNSYEILQFDGSTFPPELGKGYGEMQIVKYALEHSKLLKECDYVIKITGRYCVENIKNIIDLILSQEGATVIADYDKKSNYTYSGLFIASPIFFFDYLFAFQSFINDSEGRFFEHALHKAITQFVDSGGAVSCFPVRPIITGYSGTWNVKMDKNNYKDIVMSPTKFKMILQAYWIGLKKRLNRFVDFF